MDRSPPTPMKTEHDLVQESAPSSLLPLFPVGVHVSRVSLVLTAEATEESIAATERLLAEVGHSHQYLIGDYANYLRTTQGKKVARAWMQRTGAASTANAAAWVCSRVTPARRLMAPSFGHAEAVAAMDPTDQEVWLTKAFDEELSCQALRAEVRRSKAVAKDAPPQAPIDQTAARLSEAWEVFAALYEASAPDFTPEQREAWDARLFPFVSDHLSRLTQDQLNTLAISADVCTTA